MMSEGSLDFPNGNPKESVCSGSGGQVCGTGSDLHIHVSTRKDCGFDFLESRGYSAGKCQK